MVHYASQSEQNTISLQTKQFSLMALCFSVLDHTFLWFYITLNVFKHIQFLMLA